MQYINLEEVIKIHDKILEFESGLPGIKNAGQLDSLVNHIKNNK